MAQPSVSTNLFPPPNITETDLQAFHSAHFSTYGLEHFSTYFLRPADQPPYEEEEEDDSLGYYPDGVKRTLTDEQIAMFRHSEIQALLRKRRHAEENGTVNAPQTHTQASAETEEEGELADDNDAASPRTSTPSTRPTLIESLHYHGPAPKKGRKSQKKRGGGPRNHQQVKPDLRKRTWDAVDRGLQSLEYGDEDSGTSATRPAPPQRRRISYDDV